MSTYTYIYIYYINRNRFLSPRCFFPPWVEAEEQTWQCDGCTDAGLDGAMLRCLPALGEEVEVSA